MPIARPSSLVPPKASYGERVVRLVQANIKNDAGPEEEPGVLPLLWHHNYAERLAPLEADWLGLAELTYSQARPDASAEVTEAAERRWRALQETVGMRGFRAHMGQGRNPTGLLVRESTFVVGPQYHHPKVFRTPPTNVQLTLADAPEVPIVTAEFHSAFCSPVRRAAEAYELSALVDKVKAQHGTDPELPWAACWLFGDANEYPVAVGESVPEIDWSTVTDLVHRRHRALKQADGSWRSCTMLDELMLDCNMHDPARFAARRLGQLGALAPTAGFAAVGQGSGSRIDRGYMDPWTIQAVVGVTVLDMTGVSDHHTLIVDLSHSKLVEALRRAFEPLPAWSLVA